MLPIWLYASYRLNKTLRSKQVPLLALASAFSFVIMMFNIPMPGGTSGHMVGAALIGIILGPWAGVVTMTVTIAIQAFIMRDGGITAIGANCFTMAFLMPVSAYILYQIISGRSEATSRRRLVAAVIAAFISMVIAGTATGLILGSQYPQYFPYPLNISVPAMLLDSTVFGIFEAAVTGLVFAYIQQNDVSLIAGKRKTTAATPTNPPAKSTSGNKNLLRNMIIGLLTLILLTPLGLFATGTPFGEWDVHTLQEKAGFVPTGINQSAGNLWTSPLSDYGIPGVSAPVGYIISAIVGVALCGCLIYLVWRFAAKRESKD